MSRILVLFFAIVLAGFAGNSEKIETSSLERRVRVSPPCFDWDGVELYLGLKMNSYDGKSPFVVMEVIDGDTVRVLPLRLNITMRFWGLEILPWMTHLSTTRIAQAFPVKFDEIKDDFLIKIRLYGIHVPELSQTYGRFSKDKLKALTYQQEIKLKLVQQKKRKEVTFKLYSSEKYINREMLLSGYARYSNGLLTEEAGLKNAEYTARASNRGLWGIGAQNPWGGEQDPTYESRRAERKDLIAELLQETKGRVVTDKPNLIIIETGTPGQGSGRSGIKRRPNWKGLKVVVFHGDGDRNKVSKPLRRGKTVKDVDDDNGPAEGELEIVHVYRNGSNTTGVDADQGEDEVSRKSKAIESLRRDGGRSAHHDNDTAKSGSSQSSGGPSTSGKSYSSGKYRSSHSSSRSKFPMIILGALVTFILGVFLLSFIIDVHDKVSTSNANKSIDALGVVRNNLSGEGQGGSPLKEFDLDTKYLENISSEFARIYGKIMLTRKQLECISHRLYFKVQFQEEIPSSSLVTNFKDSPLIKSWAPVFVLMKLLQGNSKVDCSDIDFTLFRKNNDRYRNDNRNGLTVHEVKQRIILILDGNPDKITTDILTFVQKLRISKNESNALKSYELKKLKELCTLPEDFEKRISLTGSLFESALKVGCNTAVIGKRIFNNASNFLLLKRTIKEFRIEVRVRDKIKYPKEGKWIYKPKKEWSCIRCADKISPGKKHYMENSKGKRICSGCMSLIRKKEGEYHKYNAKLIGNYIKSPEYLNLRVKLFAKHFGRKPRREELSELESMGSKVEKGISEIHNGYAIITDLLASSREAVSISLSPPNRDPIVHEERLTLPQSKTQKPLSKYDLIKLAAHEGKNIHFSYVNASGRHSERTVTPAVFNRSHLTGFCYLAHAERTFRLDRIQKLEIRSEKDQEA